MVWHNLPSFPTSFIGRAEEIADLGELIGNPDCRLLTLVGPGGTGKTRLAVEVARRKLDEFPDGVYFVPLQPLQSADQVLPAIIDALPLRVAEGPERQLLDYLYEKHLLLLLDNFEHVLGSATLVSRILAEAPHVKMVITSREVLNLRGEWVRQVAGLVYPEDRYVDGPDEYSAMVLFVDCAERLRSDFSPERECEHVISICQLVEGMPLALELAAGWTTTLSCAEIAGEIQRNIDILKTDQRDRSQRHQSIRAVFDRSWHMLSEDEQTAMRRFAVFRGGCTREAAEQVTGATLETLAGLVAKSMLRRDPEYGRYDVHELLRQFAQERLLAAGEGDTAQDTHCRYYATFMKQRAPDVKGRRQLEALNEIEADWDNVRAAWNRALLRRDGDVISQMIETLHLFCDMHARYFDGDVLFQQAVDRLAPGDALPGPLWGELLVRAAEALALPESKTVIDRVRSLLDRAVSEADMGDHPLYLWVRGRAIDLDALSLDAMPLLEASLAGFRARDDRYYMTRVLRWMAYIYSSLIYVVDRENPEYLDRATALTQQHLDLTREIGDESGMAHSLAYMGFAAALEVRLEEAERYFGQAGSIWRKLGDWKSVAVVDYWTGYVSYLDGDFDRAKSLLNQVINAASEVNFPWIIESARDLMGQIACLEGDYLAGRQILMGLPSPAPYPPRAGLLFAACGLGDFQFARQRLQTALAWCLKHPFPVQIAEYFLVAAMILADDGERLRAAELIGSTFSLPDCATGWMERWALLMQLREQLAGELGPDAFADAWVRGAKRDPKVVTAELLAYFGDNDTGTQTHANQALVEPLTPRELEVLAWLALGRSNRQIAEELVVTVGTVKRYVYDICQKLEAGNRTHAVARARELGLL